MKNKKFIAIVMVLSIMLMGAGYAAWTQNFTVTADVDTGNMDILVSEVDMSDEVDMQNILLPDYTTGTLEVLSSTYAVNIDIEDMYPGAQAAFDIEVKNVGTMGIKIDKDAFVLSNKNESANGISAEALELKIVSTDHGAEIVPGETEIVQFELLMPITVEDSENSTGDAQLQLVISYEQFNQ